MNRKDNLLVGAFLVASLAFPSCDKVGDFMGSKDGFDNVDLVPVCITENKWSFMDPDGNILFEDEFEGYLTMAYNGYFLAGENDKSVLYKLDGNKYTEVDGMDDLKGAGYVVDGMIVATRPKSRIAVFDTDGKQKFELGPIEGREIIGSQCAYSEGLLGVATPDGKWGFINKDGEVVIKPQYDVISTFNDGYCLVGDRLSPNPPYKMKYSVIDKEGNTVFKLKDGDEVIPARYMNFDQFSNNGYMVVMSEDKPLLYNMKGEVTSFPDNIKRIGEADGKYVTFMDENMKCGVCDLQGEIIVKPQYINIQLNGSDGMFGGILGRDDAFVATTEDQEVILLNKKGEKTSTLTRDVMIVLPYGKFGFVTRDSDNRISVLDKEGKEKCHETILWMYHFPWPVNSVMTVKSDYFDMDGIARAVADLVDGNKVAGYELGGGPKAVLGDRNPDYFEDNNEASLSNPVFLSNNYSISCKAKFDDILADRTYRTESFFSADSIGENCSWNPEARLYEINLTLNVKETWGEKGLQALEKAFKDKGFAVVRNKEDYAQLKKGAIGVLLMVDTRGSYCNISIVDTNIPKGMNAYNDWQPTYFR